MKGLTSTTATVALFAYFAGCADIPNRESPQDFSPESKHDNNDIILPANDSNDSITLSDLVKAPLNAAVLGVETARIGIAAISMDTVALNDSPAYKVE